MKKIRLLLALTPILLPLFGQKKDTTTTEKVIPKRIYLTKKVNTKTPTIDGKLEDAAWSQVAWGSEHV